MRSRVPTRLCVALAALFPVAADRPPARAVAATSTREAAAAGVAALDDGGSAADAALATALTQVALSAGSYVSYAGVLSLVYYDASTGRVFCLNAGFDTVRGEADPLSIPAAASGRTALVPGFMAGVGAAHQRFGKQPFARLFDQAVAVAEDGVEVDPDLAAWLQAKKDVLGWLPDTRRVFTRPDGKWYTAGDRFRQPDLARTLRRVAKAGAAEMYTGAWAHALVAAVRADGGALTADDLAAYRPTWEEPVRTAFGGCEVFAPGFSSREGVNLVEALNLVALADLKSRGHPSASPESLFWLCQVLGCQELMWLPADKARHPHGLDLTPASRVTKGSAGAIWGRMKSGNWRYGRAAAGRAKPAHSDAVVAVDRWGSVAALTHTINTDLWGRTGIVVGGVSVPDAAAAQKEQVREAGPGKRLPDTMGPVVVLRGGKPVLTTSAIGSGLHEKTVQVLADVLEFGTTPEAAADAAYPLPRTPGRAVRLIEGA